MTVVPNDDAVRWRAAMLLASGGSDDDSRRLWQHARRAVEATGALTAAVAVAMVALFAGQRHEVAAPAQWRAITSVSLLVIGAVMLAGYLAHRTWTRTAGQRERPDAVLSRGERTALRQQMRRRMRISAGSVPLIQLIADASVQRRRDSWFAVGGLLVVWANVIGSSSPELWTVGIALAALVVRFVPMAIRDVRCARMFLRLYPLGSPVSAGVAAPVDAPAAPAFRLTEGAF